MGYTSDVVIAVHKEVMVKRLIHGKQTPKPLTEATKTFTTEIAQYWVIQGWKWYESYPEIQEINAFIDEVLEEDDVKYTTSGDVSWMISPMGAMRMGEDDHDVQEWGDPSEYGIGLSRFIDFPKREEQPCAT